MEKVIFNDKEKNLQEHDQGKIEKKIRELLYQLGLIEYRQFKLKTNSK